MNRRSFFQTFFTAVGALTIISSIGNAQERRRGGTAAAGAKKLVDPKDSAAKAVNYVHETSQIKDKALMTDRAGVKFKDQNCENCQFYTKAQEDTVEGKKAAPCQMPFAAGKYVAQKGWCSTWAKKA